VRPVSFGLPDDVLAALATPGGERSAEQRDAIRQYYLANDAGWKERKRLAEEAAKPRPVDPLLQEKQERLELVSKPLKVDPKLARLRADVELSTGQLKDRRLTAAQDITWALINTPAFLFNR
jgi:hypothetical protein